MRVLLPSAWGRGRFPVIVLGWRHTTACNRVPHSFDIEVISSKEHADY